jgi:Domain of unknown function (DUF1843)
MERSNSPPARPLYSVTIQHIIAEGDLAKMRLLRADAEKFMQEHGDVGVALEMLKIEIAKMETRRA